MKSQILHYVPYAQQHFTDFLCVFPLICKVPSDSPFYVPGGKHSDKEKPLNRRKGRPKSTSVSYLLTQKFVCSVAEEVSTVIVFLQFQAKLALNQVHWNPVFGSAEQSVMCDFFWKCGRKSSKKFLLLIESDFQKVGIRSEPTREKPDQIRIFGSQRR